MAGGHPTLLLQFLQRLGKGQHHMGGGGKAPLSILVHGLPLVIEVQRQGPGLAGTGLQLLPVGQDEGKAGHPLNALVGAGHQEINAPASHRDVHAAEGGHGVHKEGLAGGLYHPAHSLHIVEDAAGGLPMDHGHVGDGQVLCQVLCHHVRLGTLVVVLLIEGIRNPRVAADLRHPQAVGPVGRNEELVLPSDDAGEHRLHAKGSAALHEHSGVLRLGHVSQRQQRATDGLGDLLVIVIPGAVVKEHHLLHGVGGGQRAGGEQFIGIHGMFLSLYSVMVSVFH